VREDEGEHLLLSPSGNLRIPLGSRAWAQVQQARQGRVRVGIRPFDIRLNDPGQDGNLVDIEGARIAISEWLGDESHVMVDVDGTQMIAVAPPSFMMGQGAPVRLSIHPEYVHLFDGESGRLLAEVA
jgi:multiple sugar transport system ATP-binding protein